MKKIIKAILLGFVALAGCATKPSSNHAATKAFFVSSLHYGKIGKVLPDGTYVPFIDYEELLSSIGLLLDAKRNLLFACVSDPGVSLRTTTAMQGKQAKLLS